MRRSRLALAILLLVAAACGRPPGDRGDETVQYGDGVPGRRTTTTAARAGDGPAGASGAAGGTTAKAGERPRTRDGRTTPGAAPPPPAPPAAEGATGPPGSMARTLLRPQPATTLVLEVLQQSGASPGRASMDHATSVLRRVSGKRVSESGPVAIPGGARDWTAGELRSTADRLGKAAQGGNQAVIRALFVRGTFEGSEGVLGAALRGDVVAIFTDSVAAAETPLVGRGAIEPAVLMHEIGHLLGLVDLVRDTGRADPAHPGHSRNEESVMYWAVESSVVTQVLQGGPPRDFDAEDVGDLNALRNGA